MAIPIKQVPISTGDFSQISPKNETWAKKISDPLQEFKLLWNKKMLKSVKAVLLALMCAIFVAFGSQAAKPHKPTHRIVAYVTSWGGPLPDPQYMTNINYAFGHVNDTFDGVNIDNPERLRAITALKRNNPHLQVQLSIGGWGSGNFSEMAADPKSRKAFAKDCKRLMKEYDLDGIDIDWEYPTSDAGGISASADDTKNFTLLMHDLRKELPGSALLSFASVCNASYIDFKSVMPYVDFVNVMSYDMGEPYKHHSPLFASDICGENSAEWAINTHVMAGVPANKLVMGMPFYGRGQDPYPASIKYNSIQLKDGCTEQWDPMACEPYIADKDGRMVLGFDNPRSIKAKCDYILGRGLLGAMYWEYSGDKDSNELREAVRQGIPDN